MADRRRRRRRASQDSDESDSCSESSGSSTGSTRSSKARGRELREPREPREPEPAVQEAVTGKKSPEESECESEDGVGEAVLSDYDSADAENGSHSEGAEEEEAFTEETTTEQEVIKTPPTEAPPSEALPTEDTATQDSPTQDSPTRDEDQSRDDTKEKNNVTGERQSGDGQESTEHPETKLGGKQKLDDDEDRKNPAYIPRRGLFFEHDLRGATQEEERPKGRNRRLWKDEGRWEHDKFREEEQAPKSREELISMYGYDIRNNTRTSGRGGNTGGAREQRRERRTRPSVSPEQRWREAPRGPSQAPPPHIINQSAPCAPRTRAPPPRTRPQNNGPYKSEAISARAPNSRGERNSPQVALEFTAGGGGVATARGGRGFRDDITVVNATNQALSEGGGIYNSSEQKPLTPDPAPPITSALSNREESPCERPVERKSYSLVRRTRSRPADMGSKQTSVEDTPPASKDTPTDPPTQTNTGLSDMDQDLARLSLGQNWSQSPTSYIRSEIRGLSAPLHVPSGQFQPLEEISSNRAKRYSSHRQRSAPEPTPPMHLGVMEGHYYDPTPVSVPVSYQGPMYAHGEGAAPLPPQGMLVQPEMHLPHPGLHPHQSGAPITNPALYGAPPVSLSPGQPQQLLPPPFYPPPGVMTFPYPAMYPTPQAQAQVTYGGVTYYDTVQQQAQPKPSPPRRTSQPVTVKAPPPIHSELPYASE
ncbi:unnamed protein product [Knipowitschia caucasica]|uniref:Protein CASC3 n=1 Tax=Knipowitschia caucasica TaxID=637954 RepID=A0AAV2KMA3_KNICA